MIAEIEQSAPRTDVHRPSALVTEDYEFAFCDVHNPPDDMLQSNNANRVRLVNLLLAEGYRFGGVHGSGQCDHCGTRINYYAVLKHLPSKRLIEVGETCLANRFDRATSEFRQLHAEAAEARAQGRISKARQAFVNANPRLCHYLLDRRIEAEATEEPMDNFYGSLLMALYRNGSLSERQLAALARSIARNEAGREQREAEQAAEPEPSPVIEGKIEITGKVLAVKSQESYYGGSTLKMLVLDDRGFKVWGTRPSKVAELGYTENIKGHRVSFTATVERSDDDPCFGFFGRPTKARCLDPTPED